MLTVCEQDAEHFLSHAFMRQQRGNLVLDHCLVGHALYGQTYLVHKAKQGS